MSSLTLSNRQELSELAEANNNNVERYIFTKFRNTVCQMEIYLLGIGSVDLNEIIMENVPTQNKFF